MVLDHSKLIEHYQAEREGADRVENLQELVNAAESFVTQEGFGKDAVGLPVDEAMQSQADFAAAQAAKGEVTPNEETGETLSPLVAFLTHAALESGDNQAQAGQDAVQLMTVHAAKGLEFDCVFITGLEEGLFPHENAMSDFEGWRKNVASCMWPSPVLASGFTLAIRKPACCMAKPATTSRAVSLMRCPSTRSSG
jgi:DNA helicase II / ATP-dependent DNA helicase PcrA